MPDDTGTEDRRGNGQLHGGGLRRTPRTVAQNPRPNNARAPSAQHQVKQCPTHTPRLVILAHAGRWMHIGRATRRARRLPRVAGSPDPCGGIIVQRHHLRKPGPRDGRAGSLAGQPAAPASAGVFHPAVLPGGGQGLQQPSAGRLLGLPRPVALRAGGMAFQLARNGRWRASSQSCSDLPERAPLGV